MKHRNAARFAALVAATVLLTPVGAAQSEPPGDDDRPVSLPPGVSLADVQRQQDLEQALGELWTLVPNDGAGASGFGSVAVDRDSRRITIYWHGEVPDAIRALESSTRAEISVAAALFTQSDSDRAADYIFGLAREGRIPLPASVGLNATADEIHVLFTVEDLSRVNIDELVTATESATGARPTVTATTRTFVGASRQNDSSPWYGGSAMTRGANTYCSTGFAISKPDTPTRLLSAAHCDPTGNLAWNDGAGNSLSTGGATISVEEDGIDSMIIDPVGDSTGRVFGGPWNATSSHARYSLKVGGSYANAVGNYVCVSGAMSGENCLATQIYAINQTMPCPDNTSHTCKLHLADNSTQILAIGDSGGPVYALRDDGRVSARGIISGLADPTGCTIPTARLNTLCSNAVAFAPISTILTRWDRTIMTTP